MQRPTEIVWFERIFIGVLVLGAVNSWLAWPQLIQMQSPAFVVTVQVFTFAIMLALILLIARRRSNIAKWVMLGLFIIGLPMVVQLILVGPLVGSTLISLTQTVGQVVAFVLLFKPASRRWFKREAVVA